LLSTSGRPETNQKNHVSAADVVSRPARRKLVTTSWRLSSLRSPRAATMCARKSPPLSDPAAAAHFSRHLRTILSA